MPPVKNREALYICSSQPWNAFSTSSQVPSSSLALAAPQPITSTLIPNSCSFASTVASPPRSRLGPHRYISEKCGRGQDIILDPSGKLLRAGNPQVPVEVHWKMR